MVWPMDLIKDEFGSKTRHVFNVKTRKGSSRHLSLCLKQHDKGRKGSDVPESPIRISLCTTCRNRAYQFKQVFDQNLSRILAIDGVEWVILNYNSSDDLHSFILGRLGEAKGRIIYVRDKSAASWHSCIAKNIAHRMATGDILMNLDCDNYVGNALTIIRNKLRKNVGALHLWSGENYDGTFGRIAVKKEHFLAAGGYDESFYPMAYQDTDLLFRLHAMGIVIERDFCRRRLALINSKNDSVLHCRTDGMTWEQFYIANRNKSLANLRAGNLIANTGRDWGTGDLEYFAVSA
jgi:hypothetical protein